MGGNPEEAEALFRPVVADRRERLGEEHPDTLEAMYGLACGLWTQERFEESAQLHRQVLEARRRILGEEDEKTVTSMHNLALPLRDMGQVEEAEDLFREGLEISRRTLGNKNPLTLEFMNQLGEVLNWQDRLDESEPLIREALESRLQVLGENHWSTVDSLLCLGDLHRRRSELAEAERLFRRAMEISESVQSRNNIYATEWLFEVLIEQDKVEEARPIWNSLLAVMTAEAERSEASVKTLNRYAWQLLTVEPEEWRDAVTALAYARRAVDLPCGDDASVVDTLALAYFRTGDTARAIETQERAIALLQPTDTSLRERLETRLAEYRDSMKDP